MSRTSISYSGRGTSCSALLLLVFFGLTFQGCKDNSTAAQKSGEAPSETRKATVKKETRAAASENFSDRKPDFTGSVVTLIDAEPAECLDLQFWGEEPLRDFEIQAWREAFLPQDDSSTKNLPSECGVVYKQLSPQAVCVGSNKFEREGVKYELKLTTSHYLEKDLRLRAQECRERKGRWLAF